METSSHQPSSLQSMCHVRASEIFPKVALESDDDSLVAPFVPICGEAVEYLGRTADGVLALSNYRLYHQLKDTYYNIPLGLIEQLEVRDIFFLHIACKDARSLRCTFATNELCLDWFRRLHKATSPAKVIEDIFAFAFYAWSSEEGGEEVTVRLRNFHTHKLFNFNDEVKRLRFDLHGAWRVSAANLAYQLCPSYPRQLLVPACITDDVLDTVSRFRSSKRIPAVVWRHVGNGAVIARCSQPEVGWLGWRSSEDEDLLKAIADACAYDRGGSTMMDGGGSTDIDAIANGADDSESNVSQGKKVLIMDARSYTTAVANRARGGGVECPEYYPSCDIQFMNLANIHSIRKSFHAVRQLCSTASDQPNWFSLLENTRWIQHMSGLLRAAVTVVSAIEEEGRPVLVHCSDGWDRTSQIVSLAQLLLDPYYRTLAGFQVLVEREWLDFGHKFADRCGHSVGADDPNERCPVFLQWLDCVHQLLLQFPCAFEFSQPYLVKLAQHAYSNLFGTFLGNSLQERQNMRINERTFSAWNFLQSSSFRNHLFSAKQRVLWPSCKVRDLVVWCEVYLGAGETSLPPTLSSAERVLTPEPMVQDATRGPAIPLMNKTRSCDDLIAAQEHIDMQRRSSDPNLTLDCLNISVDDSVEDSVEEIVEENVVENVEVTVEDNVKNKVEDSIDTGIEEKLIIPLEDTVENRLDLLQQSTDSEEISPELNSCPAYQEDVVNQVPEESDNEESETTESRSEMTIYATKNFVNDLVNDVKVLATQSVESSTDTLVAEIVNTATNNGCIVEPVTADSAREVFLKEGSFVNGFAKPIGAVTNSSVVATNNVLNGLPISFLPPNGFVGLSSLNSIDDCRVCASSRKFLAEKERDGSGSSSASGKTSRYSTPPLYSRTPSSGYPTPNEEREPLCRIHSKSAASRLDEVDGLAPVQNDVQTRLQQIISEHKMKEEALQRDLHSTRLALIQQVCHHCSHTHDRQDDTGSLPESMTSNEHVSVGESLVSDVSWEAIDEVGPTLWVPDHAVSHCMGCNTTFWIGRRKHHCRNCGKIFCSDCSENTVPIPDEQLYNPVRVCTTCFTLLHPNPSPLAISQPSANHNHFANDSANHSAQPSNGLDNLNINTSLGSAILNGQTINGQTTNGHTRSETANGSTKHNVHSSNGFASHGGQATNGNSQQMNGNSRDDTASNVTYTNGFSSRAAENGYSNGYPSKNCSNVIDQSCQQGAQCCSTAEGGSCAKSVVTAVST